jgi:hypothetical protein
MSVRPASLGEKSSEKDSQIREYENARPADDPYWEARAISERRLVRKLDGRILPIACILYLFACSYHIRLSIHPFPSHVYVRFP